MPANGWALISEMRQTEALEGVMRLKRDWLLLGGLMATAVLLLAAVIARSLSRPLLQLAAASRSVSGGDLSVRTGITRPDEIGDLGRAFDRMTAALQGSYRELVTAERRLAQSAKLAAIGELVAAVVHELRNPLSAVKMNLRLVERRIGESGSGGNLGEHLSIANEQLGRLERMLNQLLDYAKPVTLKSQPIEPAALVQGAVQTFQAELGNRKVELRTILEPRLPGILGDPELLEQALGNLIRNALEAMPEGGMLTIRAESDPTERNMLAISVGDTGRGVPLEMRERIFEPFFTGRPGGTGLGLPNARKAVELHRGLLTVGSAAEGGAVFTIHLPQGDADG